jgi:hypothetical protein
MSRELACPVCNADVPMDGDEAPGAEVFCAYCRAPLKLGRRAADDDEAELEEDF